MKKLFFLLPLFLVCYIFFAGQSRDIAIEKWNIDPSFTGLIPTNESIPVVSTKPVDFVFTTQPRIVNTRSGDVVVGPNFRPHPTTNTTQSEVIIVRHPINQAIMFASANMVKFGPTFISEGVYVTTNSGVNWFGNDTLYGTPINLHSGDPGPTIDKDGRFIMTHLGSASSSSGMSANYSTNNGLTWSNTVTIATGSQDKNLAGSDDEPTSPYYGRSYCVWTPFTSTVKPIAVSYTSNGGVSWSTPQNINNPPSPYTTSQGCDVRVGPGGTVYVTWRDHGSSPYTGKRVGLGKSTNGGVTWTVTDQAFAMNGVRTTSFGSWGIRVPDFPRIDIDKTGGPRHGWIYIVTNEYNLAPAGSDADVVINVSTDGGATWPASLRKRVNQDPMNNGKLQFFPAIRVDESGGINIVYYDNRNVPTSDSAEIYVNRSVDGGTTWEEILVSDHRFRPKPISGLAGGYQGDYIGITSGNNKVWPVWMDDATGNYQLWTAALELGPSVSHTPLPDTENLNGPYPVNCVITPAGSPIIASETKLYWTRTTSFTNSVLMTNTGGNNWTANIPGNGSPATYRYYITTKDALNRTATSPPGAPAAYHSFIASPDTVDPNITHTPLPDQPKNTWPAIVNAVVTDNFGVDSAWVKWYINTPSVVRHFKLNNTSGNNYSAPFNSDTSQVQFNDVIYYKIFAVDNSSGHNVDSTGLYNFTIIAQTTACIGTGSSSCSYPFYTYYHDSRTDMLYTASEIIANGGSNGQIKKIGFDVISAAPQTMNGFEIKMQHTTATSLSGFVTTGWTTVYNGTYTVPGTGMQYITLITPFAWNGTSNVLIEICFNNTSWTTSSTVKGTSASGKTWHHHLDNNVGCSLTGGSSQTNRPNICFVIDLLTGNKNISSIIPNKYSLSQNYPNPFNPTTKITYDLPKPGFVSLKIYDVLGKEVANLVNEVRNAGSYIIDFNASHLSSGVYYYRIQAGEFMQVKKMVLVK